MQPDFKPPRNEEELQERAKGITLPAARSILTTLEQRLAAVQRPLQVEIAFYKRVIQIKESE